MTSLSHPDQPQPPSRQALLDNLNVLAKLAQAQCDAIKLGRYSLLFSPKAHFRAIMLRHVIEVLAALALVFAGSGDTVETIASVEAPISDETPAPDSAAALNEAIAQQAAAPAVGANETATSAKPWRRHLTPQRVHPARAIRATGRPANQPQRAGAAPNPNSTARARHNAPHRPPSPGATRQRPPQRLRQAARTH